MALKDDVETFLEEFKQKARIFEIYFYPREKNTSALLELGISARQREEVLMNLQYHDYYRGPTEDNNPERPDYFEFGVSIKNYEIYIKISRGKFNKSPQCMSFHIAEHEMDYPLKNTH